MNEDDLSEAIALLVGYRKLVKEQIQTVRHTRDYWQNELQRTDQMMDKLRTTRSSMIRERKNA